MYRSKTGALDKAEAAANRSIDAAAVILGWKTMGYTLAPTLLEVYLANHDDGYEYRFSADEVWQITRDPAVKKAITACQESVKDQARADPQIGIIREVTSPWEGGVEPEDDDVRAAVGHFDVAVGADVTVRQTGDGSGLEAEIDYKIYLHDFYNFDLLERERLSLNIGVDINNEMRQLEEAGWARSYRSKGETEIRKGWKATL
ncbi:hypothetical protein [Nocardia sp. NPDC048505]|uniref:hypothetical protein n=1 Tax=unclassified Nocardia TaxID=2637762 RepID=UPI0033C573CD